LNEAEQDNVAAGARWARRTRDRSAAAMLDDVFVKALHRQMFGEVWTWAGRYRTTGKNIGADAFRIAEQVMVLMDDVRHWIEHGTYLRDEIAVRLHHRLVSIHPFANGNGRHSRMMADVLVERLGGEVFGWGRTVLVEDGEMRARYIAALKAADAHDIAPLLAFARS
jgi:Fic-DOC domain mobile mystery protein B